MPDNSKITELELPFSMFVAKGNSHFKNEAMIVFESGNQTRIQNNQFIFSKSSLQRRANTNQDSDPYLFRSFQSDGIPYISIVSVVLLIAFRNLYFLPFQKYFISGFNNYEIDFNFQKIGIVPLILAIIIVLFSVAGFFSNPGLQSLYNLEYYVSIFRIPLELFGYPMLISAVFLFFLSLSGKFFPLIFSDIKIFFGLSLLLLLWNFSTFGSEIEAVIDVNYLVISLATLFFILRSLLFFQVLRKAYRFHLPLTLFYICALNLSTFLILFKVLQNDFY